MTNKILRTIIEADGMVFVESKRSAVDADGDPITVKHRASCAPDEVGERTLVAELGEKQAAAIAKEFWAPKVKKAYKDKMESVDG